MHTRALLFSLFCMSICTSARHDNLIVKSSIGRAIAEISEYVKHVARNYCYNCKFIAVISDETSGMRNVKLHLLKMSHMNYKPIILTDDVTYFVCRSQSEITSEYHIGMTQLLYVFVADLDRDKFTKMIIDVHNLQYFQSTTRVLFVFHEPITETDDKWLQDLFRIVWKSWILRAIAVFWSTTMNEMQVITFNPFLDDYYINITDNAWYNDVFQDKTQNMYGYPLYTMIQARGNRTENGKRKKHKNRDMMTLIAAVNHTNATAVILNKRWQDSTYMEIDDDDVEDVTFHQADIIFISSGVVKNDELDSLYPHEQDDICVLVPRGAAIPQVWYLFMVFTHGVWSSLIFTVIVGAACYFALNKIVVHTEKDIVMNIIRTLISGPWVRLPEANTERVLVNFWSIFGFLFCNIFVCGLTSALIERKYEPDITTLKELQATNWRIYGGEEDVRLVQKHLNGTLDPKFLARFKAINQTILWRHVAANKTFIQRSSIYKAMTKVGKPILTSRTGALQFLESKESILNGRRAFSLMPECPVPYQVSYGVTRGRGSVYANRINGIVKRLYFSGIIIHWKQMAEYANAYGSSPGERKNVDQSKQRILTLYHLQTPFYIMAIGFILSLMLLVAEVAWINTKKFLKRCGEKRVTKIKRKPRNVYHVIIDEITPDKRIRADRKRR